jgi:chaperonin GroEL (HSP60 family)
MDKMLVSPDGDVIITNDGATILEKMEVGKRPKTKLFATYSFEFVGHLLKSIFNLSCMF